jgi:hypothetical protein
MVIIRFLYTLANVSLPRQFQEAGEEEEKIKELLFIVVRLYTVDITYIEKPWC